ncbi:MAG: radical SAM protein [Candidatus Bathyarchaeota archaeon]|nr:radical SAM protein [Candidatus Bathyarchaeota archaeon]MDW8040042.1 radical SAM protein [Nitrososphaerota archaeon]
MWRLLRPDAVAVLNDEKAKRSLARYFAVVHNEKPAKFQIAKKLSAPFRKEDSTDELWRKHEALTREFYELENEIDDGKKNLNSLLSPEKSYLDLKIEIAKRMLEKCQFCVRRCGVNRLKGNLGFCKCGAEITVSSIFEHVGEEPELVPSGTIFTMGCTMRCKHCQNWTISQWIEKGDIYKPERLADEVEALRKSGCRNANLVGGEPTPWLGQWLETFKYVNVNIPVVWNSNTYYSSETAEILAGFVDVYLLDFKYGPGDCAERISEAPSYWKVCTQNHLAAKKYGELIIRVLVLPGHLQCCTKPILEWIAANLSRETRVNVMFQYRPEWRAYEIPELRRRLTRDEMEHAVRLAKEVGLTNFIT